MSGGLGLGMGIVATLVAILVFGLCLWITMLIIEYVERKRRK